MQLIMKGKPEILDIHVSTDSPLYEIGKKARFAHSTTEDTFLQDGITILHQDVFSVVENIGIEVECEISERLARQINRHRHMQIVQKSTRYNDYMDKDCISFYMPPNLPEEYVQEYCKAVVQSMQEIQNNVIGCDDKQELIEQVNYLLPLNSLTKVYYHMNLRTLIHMCNVRLCRQALYEFTSFLELLKDNLKDISDEWYYICHFYLVPECIRSRRSTCCIGKSCDYTAFLSNPSLLDDSYKGNMDLFNLRKKLLKLE